MKKPFVFVTSLAVGTMALLPGTAMAGIPVFDALNEASNFIQNAQLKKMTKVLTGKGQTGDTVYHYTQNIEKNAVSINNHTENISTATTNISTITQNNFEINNDFTWIINDKGEEIIPIPDPVIEGRNRIRRDGTTQSYVANFRSADGYSGRADDFATSGLAGSRARKAANDMLNESLDAQAKGLAEEGKALKKLADLSRSTQGHARQLQVANALAGSQIDQTMKLRSMLLASEEARAAEAHAMADKDARAIATGKRLRDGLAEAIRKATPRAPAY